MVNIFPQTIREDLFKRQVNWFGLPCSYPIQFVLQHGIDTSNLDIHSDVLKIYNYSSVHMVMLRG